MLNFQDANGVNATEPTVTDNEEENYIKSTGLCHGDICLSRIIAQTSWLPNGAKVPCLAK